MLDSMTYSQPNQHNIRARCVRGRPFSTSIDPATLASIHEGTLRSQYRGLRLLKNPFDRVLYQELIHKLQPASIIEIGSFEGGSALWLHDFCAQLGLQTQLLCLDRVAPKVKLTETLEYAYVDVLNPHETFPHRKINLLPHPWIVIEDSAHTHESTKASLFYFADKLLPGDYMVVEDGIVSQLPFKKMERFDDGPNRAVKEFLDTHPDYAIDTVLCDRFGYNATYCPNGWLHRMV